MQQIDAKMSFPLRCCDPCPSEPERRPSRGWCMFIYFAASTALVDSLSTTHLVFRGCLTLHTASRSCRSLEANRQLRPPHHPAARRDWRDDARVQSPCENKISQERLTMTTPQARLPLHVGGRYPLEPWAQETYEWVINIRQPQAVIKHPRARILTRYSMTVLRQKPVVCTFCIGRIEAQYAGRS